MYLRDGVVLVQKLQLMVQLCVALLVALELAQELLLLGLSALCWYASYSPRALPTFYQRVCLLCDRHFLF